MRFDSVFDYRGGVHGSVPGRPIGHRQAISSRHRVFDAVAHELAIETLGMRWEAPVFFHSAGNPSYAFLGRRGWLDGVLLGIVHYEEKLLVPPYSR